MFRKLAIAFAAVCAAAPASAATLADFTPDRTAPVHTVNVVAGLLEPLPAYGLGFTLSVEVESGQDFSRLFVPLDESGAALPLPNFPELLVDFDPPFAEYEIEARVEDFAVADNTISALVRAEPGFDGFGALLLAELTFDPAAGVGPATLLDLSGPLAVNATGNPQTPATLSLFAGTAPVADPVAGPVAPIPLPAALPLLAAAFGGLAMMRRRA